MSPLGTFQSVQQQTDRRLCTLHGQASRVQAELLGIKVSLGLPSSLQTGFFSLSVSSISVGWSRPWLSPCQACDLLEEYRAGAPFEQVLVML